MRHNVADTGEETSNIDKFEHDQRYFTKRLKGMYNLSYGERLLNLGLESLDVRRLRSNLVMHFEIR